MTPTKYIDDHAKTQIDALVRECGSNLLKQQPSRAQVSADSMRETFEARDSDAAHWMAERLSLITPDLPVLASRYDPENQVAPSQAACWILDPIDGAPQYLQGNQLWSMTLTLLDNGVAQSAWVYQAPTDSLYFATRGRGAHLNARPIRVVDRTDLQTCVAATNFPNYPRQSQDAILAFTRDMARALPHLFAQRWMGPASLSLAQLAAGQFDAYWEHGRAHFDWLAGSLIAAEAGAVIRSFDGPAFGWETCGLIACQPGIADTFPHLLSEP